MSFLKQAGGTASCVAAAAFAALVFHNSRFKESIPFMFIAVIALVASRFGTWAGILSTIATTGIFAVFLFDPILSIRVSDSTERDSLVWMVIGGLALSEILGVPLPTRSDSNQRNT